MEEKIIKGRWYDINKKIRKKIVAKYDRIKDWKMDPKGYTLHLTGKVFLLLQQYFQKPKIRVD